MRSSNRQILLPFFQATSVSQQAKAHSSLPQAPQRSNSKPRSPPIMPQLPNNSRQSARRFCKEQQGAPPLSRPSSPASRKCKLPSKQSISQLQHRCKLRSKRKQPASSRQPLPHHNLSHSPSSLASQPAAPSQASQPPHPQILLQTRHFPTSRAQPSFPSRENFSSPFLP